MPSPPIQVFLTSIATQPKLRASQEQILRVLQVKKIPFSSYDLASDESAKRLWKRKAPAGKQQLPGILVGGKCPGTADDFNDAVEWGELNIFLRLDENWDPDIDGDGPTLNAQAIGVPGALTPQQMTNQKPSYSATPSPLKKKDGKEIVVGEELAGFGLQGVEMTEDDLADLVKELGLVGDEAGDLVKGLSSSTTATREPAPEDKEKPEKTELPETKAEVKASDTEDKKPVSA